MKNTFLASWPCPRMTCPDTFSVFLAVWAFLALDYLGHLNVTRSLRCWGSGRLIASYSLNWGRLEACLLGKSCPPLPLCLSLLKQSPMAFRFISVLGILPLDHTLQAASHIALLIKVTVRERRTSESFRSMGQKSPWLRVILRFGSPQHAPWLLSL